MRFKLAIIFGVSLLLLLNPVSAPSHPIYESDLNGDYCTDLSEIVNYVERWQNGEISIQAVVIGVEQWQQGCI